MNGGQRNGTNAQICESKTTRIMMANVPHVTSGLGLRKFQADGFLLTRMYNSAHSYSFDTRWGWRVKFTPQSCYVRERNLAPNE